jgi:phenylpropionate dioxygenase-like ring-hydroxylating dioxygenase large terminal subunit
MNYLRNCWYQAGWSKELGCENSLARTLLETPLLFLRSPNGEISALHDRCPHRFAPLSAGMIAGGRVTCGYHGLVFDGTGACVHNPHGVVTSALCVASFPAVERHTAIWVWLGDSGTADPALIPDLSYIDATPETARIAGYVPTRAHYELLSDNILDLSHADFLHPASLGGMMVSAKTSSRTEGDDVIVEWDARNCEPPGAFKTQVPPPGKADIWVEVRWSAPAVMTLATFGEPTGTPRIPESTALTLHNMVPETSTSSHYFYCNTRPYRTEDQDFTAFLRATLEAAFTQEDKPMIERQQTRIGAADFMALGPALLTVDAAAVRARRKLAELIAREKGG